MTPKLDGHDPRVLVLGRHAFMPTDRPGLLALRAQYKAGGRAHLPGAKHGKDDEVISPLDKDAASQVRTARAYIVAIDRWLSDNAEPDGGNEPDAGGDAA